MSILPLLKKTYVYYRRWGVRSTFSRVVGELRIRYGGDRSSLSYEGVTLFDLASAIPTRSSNPGTIAVHVHVFYADLVEDVRLALAAIPFPFDLYISVPDKALADLCEAEFARLLLRRALVVEIFPNRGRDIAPMVIAFGERLRAYDFIAHLHTKKSLYAKGGMVGWREYLFNGLLGDSQRVRRIFGLFEHDAKVGMVYPQNFVNVPHWGNTWLANRGLAGAWCARFGVAELPTGYFDFPAGSMFWARGRALAPLFSAGITLDDFAPEKGQTDGTLAHVIERHLALIVRARGYEAAILRDVRSQSWSPWRVDTYLSRQLAAVQDQISAAPVKTVVFDIFDTLLVRPYIDPETSKRIVASRFPEIGERYMRMRPEAEAAVRARQARDPDIDAIYAEFSRMSGLAPAAVEALKAAEIETECSALGARADVVSLLHFALSLGKRIILASDMFLSRATIEQVLTQNGITGYHDLLLSSETGVRKDSGETYRLLLTREGLEPGDVLVIGDNERSDIQIPSDRGMRSVHVMRQTDIARAFPRWAQIIGHCSRQGLHAELLAGLMVRRFFSRPFYGANLPPPNVLVPEGAFGVGYAIVGPMLYAFSEWLGGVLKDDGVTRAFFLSREGQLLKQVYDRVWVGRDGGVPSEYLVLSRRTVSLPAIETFADIMEIANTNFHGGTLAGFLRHRFGVELTGDLVARLREARALPERDEIHVDRDARHLEPVLRVVEPEIRARVADERAGLKAYLGGFDFSDATAVVDIGYSGTIQDRLCRHLGRGVHGYYLMTGTAARAVADRHSVRLRGYYGELIEPASSFPLWRYAFMLEQFLSADDPQVVCYAAKADGGVDASFQPLAAAEREATKTRAELRHGVMSFVDDARELKNRVCPGFAIDPALAVFFFAEFAAHISDGELQGIGNLALDDHYCGRGVVLLDQSQIPAVATGQ